MDLAQIKNFIKNNNISNKRISDETGYSEVYVCQILSEKMALTEKFQKSFYEFYSRFGKYENVFPKKKERSLCEIKKMCLDLIECLKTVVDEI